MARVEEAADVDELEKFLIYNGAGVDEEFSNSSTPVASSIPAALSTSLSLISSRSVCVFVSVCVYSRGRRGAKVDKQCFYVSLVYTGTLVYPGSSGVGVERRN